MNSELERKFFELCDIVNKTVGLANEENVVFLCSDTKKLGSEIDFLDSPEHIIHKNITYSNENYEVVNGVLFVEGDSEAAKDILEIIDLYLFENRGRNNVYEKYLEFYKHLFLNDWDEETIRNKVISNGIQTNWTPILIILRCEELVPEIFTLINHVLSGSNHGVIPINDQEIVILAEIDEQRAKEIARLIVGDLEQELFVDSQMVIGYICSNAIELKKAFKDAREIFYLMPKVFKNEKVLSYSDLTIERFIIKSDKHELKKFVSIFLPDEVFQELNKDLIAVIDAMFKNNLNISEAARQTYIHRNTLVYRIDRIKKLTGLNISNFEDAVILKFSLSIQMYLQEKHIKENTND